MLTNPTMGGVAASFASLGDLVFAEPKALIGFAGPRTIKATIRLELPKGFQTSEFLLEHGFIDRIVPRPDSKAKSPAPSTTAESSRSRDIRRRESSCFGSPRLFCASAVCCVCWTCSVGIAEDDGFNSIFDGKTFHGWQGGKDGYIVQDECIVSQPKGSGNLSTVKEYGDFHLKFEFKLTPGATTALAFAFPPSLKASDSTPPSKALSCKSSTMPRSATRISRNGNATARFMASSPRNPVI